MTAMTRYVRRHLPFALGAALALLAGYPAAASADDAMPTFSLVLQNHVFTPSVIHVPAGKIVILEIDNRDPDPEEFDSVALRAEKKVPGGFKGIVHLHPLAPGHYPFEGEFHFDTAHGEVVAE